MSLAVTALADNSERPSIAAYSYNPDQLIAGAFPLVTTNVTLKAGTAGQIIKRGTVLGQITATGKYVLSVSSASDGSQVPSAIAVDDTLITADAIAGVYQTGEFNSAALIFDVTFTASTLAPLLRAFSIFLKSVVTAADPS